MLCLSLDEFEKYWLERFGKSYYKATMSVQPFYKVKFKFFLQTSCADIEDPEISFWDEWAPENLKGKVACLYCDEDDGEEWWAFEYIEDAMKFKLVWS